MNRTNIKRFKLDRAKVSRLTLFFSNTEFSLLLALLVLFVLFSVTTESFFTGYNLTNILKQAAIVGVVAVASTFVIIGGGIDLSVGSITGMGSEIVALMMFSFHAPTWLAILCAVGAAALLGLYNGIIIHEFKIAPFIATLGSMYMIRGIIEYLSDSRTITGIYPAFSAFSSTTFLGIPKMFLVLLVVVILGMVVLLYTRFGRNVFTIGSGEEVARLSGINLRLNKYGIYTVSGFLCGIAGVLLTSRISSAIPTGGSGYELTSIAAAVIGGASLSGGRGSVLGTLLGTFLMVMISNGGIQLGINPFIMDILMGVIITVAVIGDKLRSSSSKGN